MPGPWNIWDQKPQGEGDMWNAQLGMYQKDFTQRLTDLYSRAYTPEEFESLPAGLKNIFGNYAGYLRIYQRKQQGTPAGGAPAAGAAAGVRRIPAASSKPSGTKIPQAHKDIYGRVTQMVPGVRRGLGGEAIPETPEQIAAQGALQRSAAYAIPQQRELAAEEELKLALGPVGRATKTAKAITEQKLAEIRAKKTPEELMGLTKEEQARQRIEQGNVRLQQSQQRVDIQRQRMENQDQQFRANLTQKEYLVRLKSELDQNKAKLVSDLAVGREDLRREWMKQIVILKGDVPGTGPAKQKMLDAVEKAKMIAEIALKTAKDKSEIAKAQAAAEALERHGFWLERMALVPPLGADKTDINAALQEIPARKAALEQQQVVPTQRQPMAAPEVGDVRNGYEYIGGDPRLPTSWRKI